MNYDDRRDELIGFLKQGICRVNFKKVDGTIRDMECTLNNHYLPEQTDIEEQIQKASTKSDSVLVVWDTVNNGWRSFRLDSVNYVITRIK